MARASREDRKKAIDDIPDIPGGPFWRHLGPYGPAIPLIPLVAKQLAKLMIDAERNQMPDSKRDDILDHFFGIQMPEDPAITRKRQQEERWAQQALMELVDPQDEKEAQPRKKRKVSDYSKQFGIILKALKKKHPRTPVTRLMKRAHVATRKKMPKKKAVPKGRLSKGRRTIAKSGQFRRDKLLPRYKK